MNLITRYLTNNPCFTAGRSIAVKGLMLHSVGCSQPEPLVFVKNWNRSSYGNACVHGFIGEKDVYITLPCLERTKTSGPGKAHRGWHGGGASNNTYIGVEMCEPSTIKYSGGASFTATDKAAAIAFVRATTQNAVELFAQLCKYHGLDPLADGVIISHKEGHDRGIATNHGDPDHLWRGLGMTYTMDDFRREVAAKMNEEDDEMDLAGFKKLYAEMRAELKDNDSSQYSEEARTWAVSSGLIAGNGTTVNGEPNCMWEDTLTREQLVTVLYRFAQLMGKA